MSCTAWPHGVVVSSHPRLLPVWPLLGHLPYNFADHNLGLPHQAERLPEGLAGPSVRQTEPGPSHGLTRHPALLPHFRTPGVLHRAVNSDTGSCVLAGKIYGKTPASATA